MMHGPINIRFRCTWSAR